MDALLVIYVLAFLAALTGVVFALRVRNIREAAEERSGQLDWIFTLLEDAGEKLQDDDDDNVIAGLQIIAQYKAPEIRARLFVRIEELQRSESPNVSRYARWTREAIVRQTIFTRISNKDLPSAKDL